MFSENMADIELLEQGLAKASVLKDLGRPKNFLNMELEWTSGGAGIRKMKLFWKFDEWKWHVRLETTNEPRVRTAI